MPIGSIDLPAMERGSTATVGLRSTASDDALREATDCGLLVLGEVVREAMYQHIERTHQVKREEIPGKLGTFHEALQMMLGPHPAKVVERLIAKDFYGRLGLNFTEHANWTIVDYVDVVKKKMFEGLK